jgi:hypothetical protein
MAKKKKKVWVTVRRNENGGMGINGRPSEGGGGAEVPRWCGGGDESDGWRWDLDIREFGRREMREKGGGAVRWWGRNEKGKGESDLKGSREELKTHVIERTWYV